MDLQPLVTFAGIYVVVAGLGLVVGAFVRMGGASR